MPRPPADSPDLRHLSALLAEIADIRRAVERLEYRIVLYARDMGASWEAIGDAHEPPIARQTAQKKYSHPKPRRKRASGT